MKHLRNCIFLLSLFLTALLWQGCNESAWEKRLNNEISTDKDLYEVLSAKPELSVFVAMLNKTGYSEILKSANSYTVFAPANPAWTGVDTANVDLMRKTVGMMIVYNSYFSDNNALYTQVKAVNTKSIFYNAQEKTFNGAKISTGDIPAANGVIHITDKLIERKENIWDYLSTKTDNQQFLFINKLNTRIMDEEKSIATGVYPDGKTKYDTVWKNINHFLEKYPIDNEDSAYTYLVLDNSNFDLIYTKYKPYFNMGTELRTDSATRFNVCQDFVLKGIVDITKTDSVTNLDGVKISTRDLQITDTYDASNGRVYLVNQINVSLRNKIRPIRIEGEHYTGSSNSTFVLTRYKRWASGERDIAVSAAEAQSDSLWRKVPLAPDTVVKRDSVATKTYFINSNLVANINNFHVEYKANVNSCNYDVYYVAFDDLADHADNTYTNFGVYQLIQKLFISMPGAKKLTFGISENTRGVENNYLGTSMCFVGKGKAGVRELTKLRQHNLQLPAQTVLEPIAGDAAELLRVNRIGEMTMWLCNTARSNAASRQGLLFLDYILLVPRITQD